MNRADTLLNKPARAQPQRACEVPLLQRLVAERDGVDVVEIGCGRAVGTELLLGRMGAAH